MSTPAWKFFTTQAQWKAYLQDLLSRNDTAVVKAIVCIDNRQTEPERSQGVSTEENGVGWTKHDAKEMGEFAKRIRNNEPLTKGELAKCRNKMKKYWKQLMDVSKQQLAEKEAQEEATRKRLQTEQFEEALEAIRKCSEEGIACEYGICDECPLTKGYQMRLGLGMEDRDEE